MPPVQAGAATTLDNSAPIRLFVFGGLSGGYSETFIQSYSAATVVVTAIDSVAFGTTGVQCFFRIGLIPSDSSTEAPFHYDSQSTGEGDGIWFSWRGALPLALADQLVVNAMSGSSINWGLVGSGLVLPVAQPLVHP